MKRFQFALTVLILLQGCSMEEVVECQDGAKKCDDEGNFRLCRDQHWVINSCDDGCQVTSTFAGCIGKTNFSCPDACTAGCTDDRICKCDEKCPNSCNPDGSCIVIKCPEECSFGCNEDGTCRKEPCPSSCEYGCNDDNVCLPPPCPSECRNGCNSDGTCAAMYEMTTAPKTIIMDTTETSRLPVVFLSQGNVQSPRQVSAVSENTECLAVKTDQIISLDKTWLTIVSGTKKCETTLTITSYDEKYPSVTVPVQVYPDIPDVNNNHMKDPYETVTLSSCKVYSDCDSAEGKNDGFCDSFMGNKCSTKCTSDFECVKNKDRFTYICRPDGRCAPDTFETIWRVNSSPYTLTLPMVYEQANQNTDNNPCEDEYDDEDCENNNPPLNSTESIPTHCDFTIDWGDNKIESYSSCPKENLTHKYSTSGTYTVKITGTLDGFSTSAAPDQSSSPTSALTEIVSFGPIGLAANGAFSHTSSVKMSAVDIPDATKMTSLKNVFRYSSLNNTTKIENWDTSYTTTLHGAFANVNSMNAQITQWDISNVTDMSYMFSDSSFNQPLSEWKFDKIQNMSGMFSKNRSFNQDISGWDTSNVTDMSYMFEESAFSQDISAWNTANVKNMSGMFKKSSYNKNIGSWNTSNVTNMSEMFCNNTYFNQDISAWDTSNVTNMSAMFSGSRFNAPIGTWNTAKVTSMKAMFKENSTFNQDISAWNTASVTDMSEMFYSASNFNQNLNAWKTSNVTTMENMFSRAGQFNGELGSWDTSKVTTMKNMFYYCNNFNQDISNWNTANVTDMSSMFYYCNRFAQDLSKWNTSKVENASQMFYECSQFNSNLGNWNVSNITNISRMFSECSSFNQDLSKWDISKVTTVENIRYIFEYSGLDRDNYCKLMNNPLWKNFESYLGVRTSCD